MHFVKNKTTNKKLKKKNINKYICNKNFTWA